MSELNKLTFLISTINEGLYKIRLYENVANANFIIVHQYEDDSKFEEYRDYALEKFDNRFRYVPIRGRGLSKSRNYGLDLCQTDYAYVLDDDVELHPDIVSIVLEAFSVCKAAAVIFPLSQRIKMGDEDLLTNSGDIEYNLHPVSFLEMARVRSVEIALNLKNFDVRFDEDFGLGSELPSGEEFILMSDARKKDLRLYVANYSVVFHEAETSGSDFYSTVAKVRAKSLMFRRVTGRRYSLLSLLFFVKKFPVLLSKRSVIFFMRHYFFSETR